MSIPAGVTEAVSIYTCERGYDHCKAEVSGERLVDLATRVEMRVGGIKANRPEAKLMVSFGIKNAFTIEGNKVDNELKMVAPKDVYQAEKLFKEMFSNSHAFNKIISIRAFSSIVMFQKYTYSCPISPFR